MSLFKKSLTVVILIYFTLTLAEENVKNEGLPEDIIPELYEKYKDVVQNDSETVSLRRVFSNDKEYQLHIEKLKAVNGLKRHNIIVKKRNIKRDGDKEELIYITNPVETKIPNSFLSLEDFKTVLIDRVKKQREEYQNMFDNRIKENIENKSLNFYNNVKTKSKWLRSTRRIIKNNKNTLKQTVAEKFYLHVTKTLDKFITLKENIDDKVVSKLANIFGVEVPISENSKVERISTTNKKSDQTYTIYVTPKNKEYLENKNSTEIVDMQNTENSRSQVSDTTNKAKIPEISTENAEHPTESTNLASENTEPPTTITHYISENTETPTTILDSTPENTENPTEIIDRTSENLEISTEGNENLEQKEVTEAETETLNGETETPNGETETSNAETETPNTETETPNAETETPNTETDPPEVETETETTTESTTTRRKKLSRPLVFMGSGFDQRRRVLE